MNIILEKKFNEDKMRECLADSQLDIFIDALPNGIDTQIGERGSKLSGGQVQRLGIARALYRNADLIIFDESTSFLDIKTEASLIKAILNLKNKYNKTS